MFKGLGNLANLGAMLKQAQQLGSQMQEVNERLKGLRATGVAGDGLVSVEMNGAFEVVACRIDAARWSQMDAKSLEQLLPVAINDALQKAKALQLEAIGGATEALDLAALKTALGQ